MRKKRPFRTSSPQVIKKEQVMELLLGIALKTISNYLDHISPTLLDHALAGESK
jgi:hypothetical protein